MEIPSYTLQYLTSGCCAAVSLLQGATKVVKTQLKGNEHKHAVEKLIYERLGSHPKILEYYGEVFVVTESDRKPGLLLQYHPLRTLRGVMKDPEEIGRFQGRELCWIDQILDCLGYIHSSGVVHGDFGIHNLLVTLDGGLVLMDFGGSRLDGSYCLSGPSPCYRHPHLLIDGNGGCEPTEVDDIFALGTIMYEILTGEELYRGMARSAILERLRQSLYPSLDFLSPTEARPIIRKCWDMQYSIVSEILQDWNLARETMRRST